MLIFRKIQIRILLWIFPKYNSKRRKRQKLYRRKRFLYGNVEIDHIISLCFMKTNHCNLFRPKSLCSMKELNKYFNHTLLFLLPVQRQFVNYPNYITISHKDSLNKFKFNLIITGLIDSNNKQPLTAAVAVCRAFDQNSSTRYKVSFTQIRASSETIYSSKTHCVQQIYCANSMQTKQTLT